MLCDLAIELYLTTLQAGVTTKNDNQVWNLTAISH